jgi:hypothetical protein
MKISVDECGDIILEDVFLGIGIKTDMGLFGIAQRDDGIEVMLDGELLISINGGGVHRPPGMRYVKSDML